MAKREWDTPRKSDEAVLSSFERVIAAIGGSTASQLQIYVADGHPGSNVTVSSARTEPQIAKLLSADSAVASKFQLNLGKPFGTLQIERQRNRTSDLLTLTISDSAATENAIQSSVEILREFPQAPNLQMVESVLGTQLADFYSTREVGLLRLEGLAQKIIEETERYRSTLDARLDSKLQDLEGSYEAKRKELDEELGRERAELEQQEVELEARRKELDDRDNTHARRELRKLLQTELQQRGQQFTLTAGTSKKRRGVHALFGGLLALGVGFIVVTLIQTWNDPTSLVPAVRLSLGAVTVITTFIFYIRWVDSWFRQHADEEFHLKRMSLNVDRASWIVETAMEWQRENKSAIPTQLLEQLAKDIFSPNNGGVPIRHPAEEMLAAALSTASGLRMKLPNGVEASFDRRGVRRLHEKMEDQGAGAEKGALG